MNLTKKSQYGILFALYLIRFEKASVKVAAKELGLSSMFLDQVVSCLRRKGILTSKRGPGGGYSLIGDPTAATIMTALGSKPLLSDEESLVLSLGTVEQKSLDILVTRVSWATHAVLNRKVSEIADAFHRQETVKAPATPSAQPSVS
jgi:DNA-binding IscR family transcriptional regulator